MRANWSGGTRRRQSRPHSCMHLTRGRISPFVELIGSPGREGVGLQCLRARDANVVHVESRAHGGGGRDLRQLRGSRRVYIACRGSAALSAARGERVGRGGRCSGRRVASGRSGRGGIGRSCRSGRLVLCRVQIAVQVVVFIVGPADGERPYNAAESASSLLPQDACNVAQTP